jgi:hypothetical protein
MIELQDKIIDTKLLYTSAQGQTSKLPVRMAFRGDRVEFLKSPFALKDEIKAMKGARWHGYDSENPRQVWSVDNCRRNLLQLNWLVGQNVYEWFDRPLVRHEYGRPLMPHQKELADAGLTYHYQIWAAEMGCVDGDAVVHVNRAGRGFKMTLRELHHKFHAGKDRGRSWDTSIPTHIRSLKGDTLGLQPVLNVLHKGVKAVVKITLRSGKAIRVTPDHEGVRSD